MLSKKGSEVLKASQSHSFVLDLKKWSEVMNSYNSGGFMYHCTPPTDALIAFRDCISLTKAEGYENVIFIKFD